MVSAPSELPALSSPPDPEEDMIGWPGTGGFTKSLHAPHMEITGSSFLFTLAGLLVTFAGFTALLFGLRQGAGARVSQLDRFIAKTVMTFSLVLTAGALLPPLLAFYPVPEAWIWRGAAVLFGAPMLALQLSYPRRRRRAVGSGPPPAIFAVLVVLGSAATLAMLVYILAGLPRAAAAYITALTVDFFTVAFGFLSALDIVMKQPTDPPGGSTPE